MLTSDNSQYVNHEMRRVIGLPASDPGPGDPAPTPPETDDHVQVLYPPPASQSENASPSASCEFTRPDELPDDDAVELLWGLIEDLGEVSTLRGSRFTLTIERKYE